MSNRSNRKAFEEPQVALLGSLRDMTLTNDLDPFSDVPQGEIADNGNNNPPAS